jgi:glycosyltransferase involved in cell wall biosynthesis
MKTLVTVVTRNNPVLLQNLINSLDKQDAGVLYDLVIADNSSDNPRHLELLNLLSKRFTVETYENDRAETTFNAASLKRIMGYEYFFFMHDDSYAYKPNWLKVYVDRAKSNYSEPEIQNTHLVRYPIGRVSGCSQPWRDFQKCKGFHSPSFFLKECLEILEKPDVWIYKYSDQERVLYSQECLKKCGMWNLNLWKNYHDVFSNNQINQLKEALNKHLTYADEGMGPKDKYPPGETWCKFMLLTEFLNAVWPLTEGYRTVGLEGDGYLEQIDGFDKPFGMNYICHFGSPHTKKWLGTKFGCSGEDVHKKLYSNDFSFILKCDKLIEEYYK